MTRRAIESLSRGLDTISLFGESRTNEVAKKARRNSTTRAVRSWRAVGTSLRDHLAETPKRYTTPR
jgi:hypothetical protein